MDSLTDGNMLGESFYNDISYLAFICTTILELRNFLGSV